MTVKTNGYDSWKKRLLFAGVALVTFSVPAFAQDSDEDLEELEGFIVTGSRIPQLDLQTVNPVLRLDAEAIEDTGFTTIGDAVRSLPFNNGQALTPTDSGTSFTSGVSTANLRGLGNNNTLVLINGRRAAPYAAPGFNGFQTVFDLNSIPSGAIDSIEILKDGASAIYGSDAVAGVMNVRLRNDYEGASMSLRVGNFFSTDGLLKKASFITGANTAKASVIMSLDWQEQNAVFARDLPYSMFADQSYRNEDTQYYDAAGWEDAGYTSKEAYLDAAAEAWGLPPAADLGYANNESSRGFPGYLILPSYGRVTFAEPTSNPDPANATSSTNLYNYQERNGLFPENRMFSFYSRGNYDISDNWYVFAEASFSRVESEVHSAPTPVDIEASQGLSVGTPLTYPAFNPYNVWNEDATTGRRRLLEPPNRINDVTSDTPRIVLGTGGDLVSDFIDNWTWEVGLLYTKNSVNNLNRNAVPDYKLQQAFNGLTRLGDGSLTWNPDTPLENRVYFNWFDENEPAFADFLSVANPNSAWVEYRSFDVNTSGTIPALSLPGGAMGFNVGVERRLEDFGNVKTDLNATGMILGGSEGASSYGQRSLNSIYAEVNLPILDNLEVQLAGRWEEYSDEGFEKDIRPKIAAMYRPVEWLSIRASYSQAFKAPDLAYLYTASQTSFTSFQIQDPVTGSEIDQLQIVTAGNPNLAPELSDNYYIGVTFEGFGKIEGLRFYVDWLMFERTDLLAQLSDFYGYEAFLNGAAEGDPLFAGAVVRSAQTGEVLYIRDDYANIQDNEYQGFDFGFAYALDTEWGEFDFLTNSTYVRWNEIDGSDTVGGYLSPEWRHTLAVNYNYGDWGANLLGVYIDGRDRAFSFGSVFGEGDTLYYAYRVDEQVVLNGSVSYDGFWDSTITVGVNNLLDQEPPADAFDPSGSTAGVNYHEPAFWYIRFDRDF